jgi:ABC-type lipoprotein export system ATPase subunit
MIELPVSAEDKLAGAQPIVAARGLCKHYDDGQIQALDAVHLDIHAGDFLSISGPSGSGKSTMLQLLGGLDSPTSGEVLFNGRKLGTDVSLDQYRRRHVGFVFQAFYLLPSLRAVENVQAPWLGGSTPAADLRDRAGHAEALLREMGLGHRLMSYPSQLSAGERQRVAIARALANDPQILLADEPTGNLDSANTARIMELLTKLQAERGMTLVLITHEDTIAESAPRHIRMRDGRIVS